MNSISMFDFTHALSQGGPALYLAVFFGGLALNLTPCVYPLIPVTISYFSQDNLSTERANRLHRLFYAFLYVLGMALTYAVLGTFAALSGKLFGTALQNPYVLSVLSLIFFLMALGEFGVFHFPSLFGALKIKPGFFGAFLMGLTMGFVAAPCIGPVVVGLLTYVASTGSPFVGMRLFLTLSFGLGMPYLFLAYFAEAVRRLPRAGGWMNWVHRAFGVLLLGLSFYYILPVAKQVRGVIFSGNEAQVSSEAPTLGEFTAWSPEAFEKVRNQNRVVLIDFVADWCAPCKEIELVTFADPTVKKQMSEMFLFKIDMTIELEGRVGDFVSQLGISGVPSVLFFDPTLQELKGQRLVQFEGPEQFKARLKRVFKESGVKVQPYSEL